MIDFCDFNKSIRVFVCCFFIATLQSCSNHSDNIESAVLAHQATIDSLIEAVIVPIRSDVENQIIENNIANKDTFQLARKRIPIKKIHFLVSNEYFVLDSLLTAYQNHKIPAKILIEQLDYSQKKVDSLINTELIKRLSK